MKRRQPACARQTEAGSFGKAASRPHDAVAWLGNHLMALACEGSRLLQAAGKDRGIDAFRRELSAQLRPRLAMRRG